MSNLKSSPEAEPEMGWRKKAEHVSLPEVHRTIAVPKTLGFWRKLLAFSGPGYLVAVGYMDPGNWATDLAGGSAFGYTLLSVILLSNLMAILLQSLCAKLGIVTGRGFLVQILLKYDPQYHPSQDTLLLDSSTDQIDVMPSLLC